MTHFSEFSQYDPEALAKLYIVVVDPAIAHPDDGWHDPFLDP